MKGVRMDRFSFFWGADFAARTKQYAGINGISQSDVTRLALAEKIASPEVDLESASDEELIAEARRRQGPSVISPWRRTDTCG